MYTEKMSISIGDIWQFNQSHGITKTAHKKNIYEKYMMTLISTSSGLIKRPKIHNTHAKNQIVFRLFLSHTLRFADDIYTFSTADSYMYASDISCCLFQFFNIRINCVCLFFIARHTCILCRSFNLPSN